MSYKLIECHDELFGLLHIITHDPDILFADIETTGLNYLTDEILLFQIKHKDVIYLIDVRQIGYKDLAEFLDWLNQRTFVFHNAKFDAKFIYHRTKILLNVFDTMTCEIVLNAGVGKQFYSLAELAIKYTDSFIEKETRLDFVDFPADKPFTNKMLTYSAIDVDVLSGIYEEQMKLVKETGILEVVNLEMNLLPVVIKMEYNGINIDKDAWLKLEKIAVQKAFELGKEFKQMALEDLFKLEFKDGLELAKAVKIPVNTKKLAKLLETIIDVGELKGWFLSNFNINSSHQVKALFLLLGIKVKNTNEKTLYDFQDYKLVEKLLEIRGVAKQISSYGKSFLETINPITNKIHTEYSTAGTRTGRFSSRNPNMQQIPREGGYRECFIPSDGYVFISLDYSQQEFRLAGALSKESSIIEAYKNGLDMHTLTAANQLEKDIKDVTSGERHDGKTLNFALLYGSTEYGLKRNLRISLDKAKKIVDKFWKGYPNLYLFNDLAGKMIMELGYSVTPLGRRRYNQPKPTFGDSKAIFNWEQGLLKEGRNFIIQGGGADMLKMAMVNIHKNNPFGDDLRLLLQIHDELLAEVKIGIENDAFEFIKTEMEKAEQPFLGEIPAIVEGKIKNKWSKE